ncbi:MAG: response regulator [Hansschlegelia sp.]
MNIPPPALAASPEPITREPEIEMLALIRSREAVGGRPSLADRREGFREGALRVHVIDDDARVRDALENLFQSTGYDVAVFTSPQEFLAGEQPESPSCLVLDIRLRGESGLDFQQQLSEQGVMIPVILTTAYGDIPMTVRGMKQGAVDFLPKPFREEEMLSAVAAALRLDQKRRETDQAAADLNERYATLSQREKQVMGFVAAGLLNKQVAGELGLSEVTVKIHRGKAMRKMGAKTLPDLVRMVELLLA